MNIVEKRKSWNFKTNRDCFNLGNLNNKDHIWPDKLGGSNGSINMQILSSKANSLKGDKTKGKIGDNWRFSIIRKTNSDGLVYGTMFIQSKNMKEKNDWYEIEPVL